MRHRSETCATPGRGASRALALALAVAVLAFLPAVSAGAQDDTDEDENALPEGLFSKNGLYFAALGHYAIPTEKGDLEDEANAALGPGTGTDVDNSFGYDFRLGYRLHERFSLETQFDFLNAIELDSQVPDPGPEAKGEINLFVLTGNAKAYLLTERFQPYLVAGAGWSRSRFDPPGSGAKERDDGFAVRMGAGFDLYGSEYVALTSEVSYVVNTGSNEDLDYLTFGAGLMLRFYMPRY